MAYNCQYYLPRFLTIEIKDNAQPIGSLKLRLPVPTPTPTPTKQKRRTEKERGVRFLYVLVRI